jgi:arginase
MPAALRDAGLVQRLGVADLGDVRAPIADATRDADTGIVGYRDVVNATAAIQETTGALLTDGRRPLVVGGDCTILVGIGRALAQDAPGAGLVFVDGHFDTYDGGNSPTGEAADMDLALVLGRGPAELCETGPLLDPTNVVVLGPRDRADMQRDHALDPAAVGASVIDETEIRRSGTGAVAAHIDDALRPAAGVWVHVDLDVLSTAAMPAVDYPQPGGLDWSQLSDLLRPRVVDPHFLGMDVTILNPTLDRDGGAAARTVDFLVDLLRPASDRTS